MTLQKDIVTTSPNDAVTIVLVHGTFVDASGWQVVFQLLSQWGYEVLVVQNSAVSFRADVQRTRSAIAAATHPVILVGHSYGGAVITEVGADEKVHCLVYPAAFAPGAGEPVSDLASQEVPGVETAPLLPPADGFITVDPIKFPVAFAVDIDPAQARFMAVAQRPWGWRRFRARLLLPLGEPSHPSICLPLRIE